MIVVCHTEMRGLVKPGFSLIELMVVTVIIGLLVTLVTVNADFLSTFVMRAQVAKLFSLCQRARQKALAYNTTQTITFDVRANRYCWGDITQQLPRGMRFGFIPGAKGPPANPTTVLYKPITFAGDHITCYPDGIIQSGTLYLVDEAQTVMYAISNAVAQVSYLRTYIYQGGWKLLQGV